MSQQVLPLIAPKKIMHQTTLGKRFLHLLLGMACTSLLAQAMVEDVCYPNDKNNKLHNCITLPPNCSLKDSKTTLACRAETLAAFLVNMEEKNPGRSLIHTDATYIIAAAVGFTEKDAYWIAAYDQATDLKAFTPKDVNGEPVNAIELTTSDIGGMARTSYSTGGLIHHYLPVEHPGPEVNGLHPDVHDPNEVTLSNLRAWAFNLNNKNGNQTSSPLCAAGITTSPLGSSCYNEAGQSVPIKGVLSLVYPVSLPPFTFESGFQIISPSQDGVTSAPPENPVYSNDFVSYIGENFADAALGTYVHSLADRVSHHVCTDIAPVIGPLNGGKGFFIDLGNQECSQLFHELRHLYETGVPFNQLEPQDRTTEATLSIVYDELVAFAQHRGTLKQSAKTSAYKAALLNTLISALQVPDALDRMTAVTHAGCAKGITPFPGAPSCSAN
jgi:hypothetical protein